MEDNGFGFNSIAEVREDEWASWGIVRGAVLAVRRNQKGWISFRHQQLLQQSQQQGINRTVAIVVEE